MAFLSICWLIIIAFVIVGVIKKTKEEQKQGDSNGKWKKIGFSLLLFIPFFVVYYMLVAIIICIPLAITGAAGQTGWVFGIIGGMAIAPIFTVITIYKVVWDRNKK